MKNPFVFIPLLMILLFNLSCQDKTRDDAKFLGHYETDVKKDEINSSYESIDITIDENDPEYPYLVTNTHYVQWFINSFYGKKIDKKNDSYVNVKQNCQIKDGILKSRESVRPQISFEVVEKDGKFVKFIFAINQQRPSIGTIRR